MNGYTKERWTLGPDGNIYDTASGQIVVVPPSGYRKDRAAMMSRAPEMYNALYDIATNYDHDEDAHRYGTHCRTCMAVEAIQAIVEKNLS
jgi:hypothetical protein